MKRAAVSIIVPAYNAQGTLEPCLAALRGAMSAGDELILFDDGSTDATGAIATAAGARIITGERRATGPANGRNIAAWAATREQLLFVDADVVLHADAIDLLARAMTAAGATAAFGSYDDAPRSRRAPSLYANLRHHYVHQHGHRAATTFWSGIGMIERAVFLEAGGFDVDQFAFPSIEDVELGMRLIGSGRKIVLVPEAQGAHWKEWSLWRVWHTDVVRRALPWSRLIADGQVAAPDLNLSHAERMLAALALLVPFCLVVGLAWRPAWLGGLAAAFLYLLYNRRFFGFLAKRLAPGKLIAAVVMHWCYHIYASITFAAVLAATRLGLRGRSSAPRAPTTQ